MQQHTHHCTQSHSKVKAVEFMVCDALRAADRSLHFTANVDNPQHFVKLDDGLLRAIRNFDALVPDAAHSSEYKGLREAQDILDRLEKRQLYRWCFWWCFWWWWCQVGAVVW